jgi:hypothetical protein
VILVVEVDMDGDGDTFFPFGGGVAVYLDHAIWGRHGVQKEGRVLFLVVRLGAG